MVRFNIFGTGIVLVIAVICSEWLDPVRTLSSTRPTKNDAVEPAKSAFVPAISNDRAISSLDDELETSVPIRGHRRDIGRRHRRGLGRRHRRGLGRRHRRGTGRRRRRSRGRRRRRRRRHGQGKHLRRGQGRHRRRGQGRRRRDRGRRLHRVRVGLHARKDVRRLILKRHRSRARRLRAKRRLRKIKLLLRDIKHRLAKKSEGLRHKFKSTLRDIKRRLRKTSKYRLGKIKLRLRALKKLLRNGSSRGKHPQLRPNVTTQHRFAGDLRRIAFVKRKEAELRAKLARARSLELDVKRERSLLKKKMYPRSCSCVEVATNSNSNCYYFTDKENGYCVRRQCKSSHKCVHGIRNTGLVCMRRFTTTKVVYLGAGKCVIKSNIGFIYVPYSIGHYPDSN